MSLITHTGGCHCGRDGYSVNARCLDEGTVAEMTICPSDGKNWEKTYPAGARSARPRRA